jgi:hypothetical protein
MDWYVIQAYSGYEQKVKLALEEKIELNNLSAKFGEILIPTETVVELKAGQKKTTERKFFPLELASRQDGGQRDCLLRTQLRLLAIRITARMC